jgi:hypothetical protein
LLFKFEGFAVVGQGHFGRADFRLEAVDLVVGAPILHDLRIEIAEASLEVRDVFPYGAVHKST